MPIFFSILVVAIFNPIQRWLEQVVDRYIYRQEYDSAQVQSEISFFLRTLEDAPAFAEGFVLRVVRALRIAGACVLYRVKNTNEYIRASTPLSSAMSASVSASYDDLVELLGRATGCGISRGELMADPRYRDNLNKFLSVFDQSKAALFMPLVYEREIRGVVCFGAKLSGQAYSAEDLRLLVTLTEQLALSLENGRLYQESIEARLKAEATNKRLLAMDRVKKDFVANICRDAAAVVSDADFDLAINRFG